MCLLFPVSTYMKPSTLHMAGVEEMVLERTDCIFHKTETLWCLQGLHFQDC